MDVILRGFGGSEKGILRFAADQPGGLRTQIEKRLIIIVMPAQAGIHGRTAP
jgi:hypothetical protein